MVFNIEQLGVKMLIWVLPLPVRYSIYSAPSIKFNSRWNSSTQTIAKREQLQFVEHSDRRKMKNYSMRRKNSISANIFIWLYFVAISIFVVWLGRFAPIAS